MKVIIAGSRGITSLQDIMVAVYEAGFRANDNPITEVVSGGAKGADTLGEVFAGLNSIPVKRFIPEWVRLGKKAGLVRNEEMGNYADALVAVWDGESRGTKHMIDFMKSINKPVFIYIPKSGLTILEPNQR